MNQKVMIFVLVLLVLNSMFQFEKKKFKSETNLGGFI